MSSPNLFRIGEMARLFHLSVSSIRHYEAIGLIHPDFIDPVTGYRYYSPRQFEAFNAIRYLRALDVPLPEIADFLQNRDVDKIEEKLQRQKAAVAEKQRELARIERKIDNRLGQLRDAQTAALDCIQTVDCPACSLFWVDGPLRIADYADMELPTSRLTEAQDEAAVFLGKVGVSVSAEHLCAGQFAPYDGIFLLLDAEDHFVGEVMQLPPSRCVSVRFRGSHPEAPAQYRRLMDFIRAHGLQVAGFSREIVLIDYGITRDTQKFVTEIRIPVTKK